MVVRPDSTLVIPRVSTGLYYLEMNKTQCIIVNMEMFRFGKCLGFNVKNKKVIMVK